MSIHINGNKGDIAESVLLPGDPLRAKHIAENYLTSPKCYSNIRNMLGYTGTYKGVPVSIQGTGMGMPSMGIYSWELISDFGVKNLIRIGTAGSFHHNIKLGDLVIATATSTDSNYHHAFDVPSGYSPNASWDLLIKAKEISKSLNINLKAGNVVSCDVFYETIPDWWKKWSKMQVLAVEMEAAALYMNCNYHGVNGLALMTITDEFLTGNKSSTEERLKANDNMFKLALEIAIK